MNTARLQAVGERNGVALVALGAVLFSTGPDASPAWIITGPTAKTPTAATMTARGSRSASARMLNPARLIQN